MDDNVHMWKKIENRICTWKTGFICGKMNSKTHRFLKRISQVMYNLKIITLDSFKEIVLFC